jgi:Aldo/keto reductase family
MAASVPDVRLNNGVRIPQLGYGVFRVPNESTVRAVRTAIECGYRSIDTASLYGNEAGVGEALATCGVPREDLFVTTKLWNDDQGYESTFHAFEASLRRLRLDYVDLYLIHWPKPAEDRYVDTWRAFEKLYADGRVRAIGVSNFQVAHLQRLLDETDVVPAINQVELHLDLQQAPPAPLPRPPRHRHRGLEPARGGRGVRPPGRRRAGPPARPEPGPDRAPLARAAGQRRHPEVDHAVSDQGEHRGVRFRAERRRDGCARWARDGNPPRPRPGRPGRAPASRLLQRRWALG